MHGSASLCGTVRMPRVCATGGTSRLKTRTARRPAPFVQRLSSCYYILRRGIEYIVRLPTARGPHMRARGAVARRRGRSRRGHPSGHHGYPSGRHGRPSDRRDYRGVGACRASTGRGTAQASVSARRRGARCTAARRICRAPRGAPCAARARAARGVRRCRAVPRTPRRGATCARRGVGRVGACAGRDVCRVWCVDPVYTCAVRAVHRRACVWYVRRLRRTVCRDAVAPACHRHAHLRRLRPQGAPDGARRGARPVPERDGVQRMRKSLSVSVDYHDCIQAPRRYELALRDALRGRKLKRDSRSFFFFFFSLACATRRSSSRRSSSDSSGSTCL